MNKLLLLVPLICIAAANCLSQPKLPKVYGAVKVNDSTLMLQSEVTLRAWFEFIADNNFDESLFPDSTCLNRSTKLVLSDLKNRAHFKYLRISSNSGYDGQFGEFEISHGANFGLIADADTNYFSLEIPVTGITFNQAQRFCRWKETKLNSVFKQPVNVNLPSVGLYKKVIVNIDTLSKGCMCAALNSSTAKNKNKEKGKPNKTQGKGLVMVNSYFPTSLGLFGLQGNAAEMTDTEGIAMGGSFRQTARESYNDRDQKYDKPADWLGFRYVVTLK